MILEGILAAVKVLLEKAEELLADNPEVNLPETKALMLDCEMKLNILRAWQDRLRDNVGE